MQTPPTQSVTLKNQPMTAFPCKSTAKVQLKMKVRAVMQLTQSTKGSKQGCSLILPHRV
jgi:hypothetical protein